MTQTRANGRGLVSIFKLCSVQSLDRLDRQGGHEGRFSRDSLPVFFAGGHCQQFWHGQGCPLFDVVHQAFPPPMIPWSIVGQVSKKQNKTKKPQCLRKFFCLLLSRKDGLLALPVRRLHSYNCTLTVYFVLFCFCSRFFFH